MIKYIQVNKQILIGKQISKQSWIISACNGLQFTASHHTRCWCWGAINIFYAPPYNNLISHCQQGDIRVSSTLWDGGIWPMNKLSDSLPCSDIQLLFFPFYRSRTCMLYPASGRLESVNPKNYIMDNLKRKLGTL